jgi:hypothetical protein
MNDYKFDSAVLDSGGGGHWDERFARAQGKSGGTVWTDEAVAHAAADNQKHRDWLASEPGAHWFNTRSWNVGLPLVRVRRLGLQQHPGGGSMMLYNTVSGYVLNGADAGPGCTVTLPSLVKQGYRIEVVQ